MRCRFGTKHEPPYEIAAGATDVLDCTLEVVRAGEFENQLHVYVNDAGLREIVLKVHGKVETAEAEASNDIFNEHRPGPK